jgi:hypothetical protein
MLIDSRSLTRHLQHCSRSLRDALLILLTAATLLPLHAQPTVFVSPADLARARTRATQQPWARQFVSQLIERCDSMLTAPITVPEKAGQWGHHYVCKQCGGRLEYQAGKHECPRCHIEYKGWPYDEVIAGRQHIDNLEDIRALGAAYALTSETRYAQRARQLLIAYADRYTSLPIHDYKGGQMEKGARLFAQTLDESVHSIQMLIGYDLVRSAPVFSATDRAHIDNDLLRPIAATIRRNRMNVSNWQSWHDAALAGIGYLVGDKQLVQEALHGPDGFDLQMQKSILSDGFWYEGSATYHYYALEALRWTVLVARNSGEDLTRTKPFRAMFDAPLDYIFPDGRFPSVNDSEPVQMKAEADLYEFAYSWYKDPRYAAIVKLRERGFEALFWGADELPQTPPANTKSRNFGGLGAVMLRAGSGPNQLAAHLDYGPHGGAHGHFDKLGVIFFANKRTYAPDPGRLQYGAPLHLRWYKTTLAHNTIIIDGRNQDPAEGKLDLFKELPGAAITRASCDTAYPGLHLQRTLALTPSYLLDVFTAQNTTSTQQHTFDLAWHLYGKQTSSLSATRVAQPLGADNGYQVLANVRAAQTDLPWSADYHFEKTNVRLNTLGAPGTTVYFADGLSDNPPTTVPLTLCRRTGTSAQFISLLQPVNSKRKTCSIDPLADTTGPLRLTIQTPSGTDTWELTDKDVTCQTTAAQNPVP